jgi:hypothetical protein
MALAYKYLDGGSGIAVDANSNPIVFDDENEDEKEFGLDAIHLYSKIPALQAEAKKYREERQVLQTKLEPFGEEDPVELLKRLQAFGDLDPEKAKKAVSVVSNLDDLDKDKNIEIERVKAGVAESYKSKIKDIDIVNEQKISGFQNSLTQKDQVIRNLLIRGAFDRSEFIKDQTVLTSDIAYDSFGRFFQVEEDGANVQVFALDRAGEKIFSKASPGEYASPEEAIELIINGYPQKDSILRSHSGGSGAGGNKDVGGSKKAKLRALAAMGPAERLNALRR